MISAQDYRGGGVPLVNWTGKPVKWPHWKKQDECWENYRRARARQASPECSVGHILCMVHIQSMHRYHAWYAPLSTEHPAFGVKDPCGETLEALIRRRGVARRLSNQ